MPSLPPELLLHIAEEAAASHRTESDYTTLFRLCLTSHDFLPIARAALYRDVEIEVADSPPMLAADNLGDSSRDVYQDLDEEWRVTVTSRIPVATLEAFPSLASLVEGVTVNFVNVLSPAVRLPAELLSRILRTSQGVVRLSIRNAHDTFESEALVEKAGLSSSKLQTLEAPLSSGLRQSLSLHPSLTSLVSGTAGDLMDEVDYPPNAELRLPFSLVTLVEQPDEMTLLSQLFASLISNSLTSLTRLNLTNTTIAHPLVAPYLPSLSALTYFEVSIIDDTLATDLIVDSIVSCQHLRILTLSSPLEVAYSPFLERLPLGVETVRLRNDLEHADWEMCWKLLAESAVRRIQLCEGVWEELQELECTEGWQLVHMARVAELVRVNK